MNQTITNNLYGILDNIQSGKEQIFLSGFGITKIRWTNVIHDEYDIEFERKPLIIVVNKEKY